MLTPGTCHPAATYDPTGGYNDFADCVDFMQSIEYSSYDRGASDTFVCRSFSCIINSLRSCYALPRSGRTGVGKCILKS